MPPDRTTQSTSSSDVQKQIQSALSAESTLRSSNVSVQADDKSVTLTGTVENEQQHVQAVRIAQASASGRQVVDKVQIQKQP